MSRLPYLDPTQATPEVSEALAALPALNVFAMVAHAQATFRPWLRFGAALLSELELDPRLRELAILEVARLSASAYGWGQHAVIAQALGVEHEKLRAIEQGEDGALTGSERVVVAFTREVVHHVRAGEACLQEALEILSVRELIELLLVIGHYMGIARITETAGIELDDPARLAVIHAARARGREA